MNLLRLLPAAALFGFSGLPAAAEIIGMEQFDYPDGPVAGRNGGIHWDYKNTTPTAHTGVKSNWDTLAGSATVSNGRLMTSGDGWAKREFNGNTEVNGAVNDSSVATAVYARVTVTTGATLPGYFGISSYDFGDQRIFLGKRGGSSNFGFEIFGGTSLDGPVPVPANATFTLVFRLDFSGNAVSLFLNPNFNLPMSDPANIGTAVANAGYLGTNWSTALRLSSGGGGDPVAWDDFVVATSWEELGTVVTTLADEDNGNLSGSISLREAVKFSAAGRLITFAPNLSGQTILLNHPDLDMEVPGALIIDASALPGGLTINHDLRFRHFAVGAGKFLTLRGLNLTKGNLSLSPGLSGGSIDSDGTLILHRCQFIENYGNNGGAIASRGILQATDCNFSGNVARGGGAVWLSGPAQFVRCTLSGNSANGGAAILQEGGSSTLSHCTVVQNSTDTDSPAALAVQQGTMDLQHCTVTRNSGKSKGGGIYLSSPASVNLAFCIVADNFAFTAPDIFFEGGNQTANAPNLIGDNSSVEANFLPGPLVGTPSNRLNPRVGPLNNYGGSTPTVPLLSGSAARNVGAGSTRLTDQRGFPVLGAADFGAFEAQFSSLADVTVNEDTATGPLPFTAGFTNTITAASSNTTLLPNTGIVLAGSGASRTVTLTPAANQNGTATVTLTAATGETLSFPLTVSPVNDAPTISAISDLTINEDANTGPIACTIGDADTAVASLTVSATSSNTALVPNANITFGGSGASRSVTATPAANQSGTTTITVTVSDGTTTASDSFVLTVTAVNDAPTITNITDRTINEDANTGAIAFTIGDVETAVASLTVSATSSNTALVPNANITFGGSGASRTVTVTPAANQSGTSTITVTVSDGITTASDSFVLTVTAVNDAPTITNITDRTINEDANTGAIPFTIGDVETAVASLTVSATSSNTALVPNANITFGGSGANRTVTVTPAANQNGTSTITVTVSDGTTTASDTFALAVTAVNDAPSFIKGADVSVTNTAGAQTRSGWATALSAGPPDENAQTLSFTVTNNNNALFAAQPAIAANGTLTFTPAAAAAGTALVTVQINDTGGTANGGVNQSAAQTFNLTITAAAALVVTSIADSGPGSLRQILAEAAGQSGPNSITFASGLGTITLTGEIVITDAGGVTIDASDRPAGVVIDGGPGTNRHFRIDAGTTATFQRLRLYGGGGTGGGVPVNYGGSIHTGGTLTLRECTFSANTSANVAGVIYNQDPGLLTIERCSFYGNQAGGTGAIQHESAQRMTVTASTFANNIGRFESGALNVGNRLATLTHCTITGNAVTNPGGPGVGGVRSTFPANLTVQYSIIAGNTDANFPGTPNITAGFISQGNNLTSDDPKLAPLGDYGGPTQTMALRPGSPALNAVPASPATSDQRGFGLVGVKDLGAYEAGNNLLTNYNAWIWETLPNTATETQAAPTFDYDNDGTSNELEWLAQTGPGDPASAFRPTVNAAGGNMVISFPTATGRTYRLEYNEILAANTWIPFVGSEITGDGSLKSYSLLTSVGSRRFFRVIVLQP